MACTLQIFLICMGFMSAAECCRIPEVGGDVVLYCCVYVCVSVFPGRKFLTKVNANIGNSATTSSIEEVRHITDFCSIGRPYIILIVFLPYRSNNFLCLNLGCQQLSDKIQVLISFILRLQADFSACSRPGKMPVLIQFSHLALWLCVSGVCCAVTWQYDIMHVSVKCCILRSSFVVWCCTANSWLDC